MSNYKIFIWHTRDLCVETLVGTLSCLAAHYGGKRGWLVCVCCLGMWRLLVGEALGADMEEAGGEDAAAMVGTEDSLPKTNLPKMFILEHFSGK